MKPLNRTGRLSLLPVLASLIILITVLIAAGCTGKAPAAGGLVPSSPVPSSPVPSSPVPSSPVPSSPVPSSPVPSSPVPSSPVPSSPVPSSPVPTSPAVNKNGWTLTEYVSGGRSVQTLNSTAVTLEFRDDGRITGSAGCNHYFASYERKGTKIVIGQAGSTEMYCTAPGVMEQERAYLALLGRAASLTVMDDRLTFADAQGTPILSFARIVPPAPEPLVGTNWTLDSFYTADAVSSVISTTAITAVFDSNGHMSGSAGCNHYVGSYTATGNLLSISSLGSTKMNCPGNGIMLQEDTYLASLRMAAGFTISGNRLILADVNGTPLLSFIKKL